MPRHHRGPWWLAVAAAAVVVVSAQPPGRPTEGEWPTYGGDLASSKYSPLDPDHRRQPVVAPGRLARAVT